VWVSADTWVSAEAMGAKVDDTREEQPIGGSGEPLVRSLADLERIPGPEVERQGRYGLMVEALRRIRERVGGEVFIVACFDQYPFSLASELMGLSESLLKLSDDPGFVQAVMRRCREYGLAYARALSEAGADLLSGGDSPAGLVGREVYERLILPEEQRLIGEIKEATGKPVSLHICGNTKHILGLMGRSGADVLELDHLVELGEAAEVVGPKVALWGNLDPVGVLACGTVAEVRQAARRAMESLRGAGHSRFVLSSGCTLAVETPPENLEALLEESAGSEPAR
jgi:uroporphyrinogen decarboxylase